MEIAKKPQTNSTAPLPKLVEALVSAGFPSPAESYVEFPLDLNKLLITKPQATFFVRVSGDSMVGASIYDQDLVIIDRSLTPLNNQVIVAAVDGEFTIKRFRKSTSGCLLIPENPKYHPLKIQPETDFLVWGVVTYVIHNLKIG